MSSASRSSTIFGVDLGTTNSCVAIVKNGKIDVLSNKLGRRTTPSAVYFDRKRGETYVGKLALTKSQKDVTGCIYDAKRLMGLRFSDPSVQKNLRYFPFTVIDDSKDTPLFCVEQAGEVVGYYAEQIGAMVLAELRQLVEQYAGEMNKVVITVPAYFNSKQRQATMDAGEIAGLEVVSILNEPTAAAMAYGLTFARNKTILIYDLGGGTFDVTILKIEDNVFSTLGTDGDIHLGGSDFDQLLMEEVIRSLERRGIDVSADKKLIGKIKNSCEDAKIMLSSMLEYTLELTVAGEEYVEHFTRSRFESIIRPYIQRSIEICEQLLARIKLTKQNIDDIILVGGSTSIPLVTQMLSSSFKRDVKRTIHPDECIAIGAALRADCIERGKLLIDKDGDNHQEGVNAPSSKQPQPQQQQQQQPQQQQQQPKQQQQQQQPQPQQQPKQQPLPQSQQQSLQPKQQPQQQVQQQPLTQSSAPPPITRSSSDRKNSRTNSGSAAAINSSLPPSSSASPSRSSSAAGAASPSSASAPASSFGAANSGNGSNVDYALGNDFKAPELRDITSCTFGIGVSKGLMKPVIPANTPIPTTKLYRVKMTNAHDNDRCIKFQVFQGEHSHVKKNQLLATICIDDVPPMPKGQNMYFVDFELDGDGILHVHTTDPVAGFQTTVDIRSQSISEDNLNQYKQKMKNQMEKNKEANQVDVMKCKLESKCLSINSRTAQRILAEMKSMSSVAVTDIVRWENELSIGAR